MIKKIIGIFILIGIISCKSDEDSITLNQVSGKKYVFALVSSQQECDNLLFNGVNCTQDIDFIDNENAEVIVTDIINAGTYRIVGNILTVSLSDPDSENPMIFEANQDFTKLKRTSNGSNDIWKLQITGVDPRDL